MFHIENRRYIGNKHNLMNWISSKMEEECSNSNSLFDVFAGTGSVTGYLLDKYDRFVINDFLFSNEIIYRAFFEHKAYDLTKLKSIKDFYNMLDLSIVKQNYVSENFGGNFFSMNDALRIGEIREDINKKVQKKEINEKEANVLLASLLYSLDRIANTCGHYESFRRTSTISDCFYFDLIEPFNTENKKVEIYRADANILAERVKTDIAFLDPPYNSRQYSRFYHILENITKWEKPKLFGTALKPEEENMSLYSRVSAPFVFKDLVTKLQSKYIVVTYSNTYQPKSSSSKNKISLEEIQFILNNKGKTKVFEKDYKFFNAGKTELIGHKEFLFITKVMHG